MTFIVDTFPSYFLFRTDLTSCRRNTHGGGGGTGGILDGGVEGHVLVFSRENSKIIAPC